MLFSDWKEALLSWSSIYYVVNAYTIHASESELANKQNEFNYNKSDRLLHSPKELWTVAKSMATAPKNTNKWVPAAEFYLTMSNVSDAFLINSYQGL